MIGIVVNFICKCIVEFLWREVNGLFLVLCGELKKKILGSGKFKKCYLGFGMYFICNFFFGRRFIFLIMFFLGYY